APCPCLGDGRLGAEGDTRKVAGQARRQVGRESRDLLLGVRARQVQVERAEGPCVVVQESRRNSRVEWWYTAWRTGSSVKTLCDRKRRGVRNESFRFRPRR